MAPCSTSPRWRASWATARKAFRAKVARGLLPYRRLGSRIVFVRASISDYLNRLPGVSVDEALENLKAREAGR
jgi:hypothetical protein